MKQKSLQQKIWQIFLVLLPIPITVWLTLIVANRPEKINSIEYYQANKTNFIALPEPIENEVIITYNDKVIENLSSVSFYLLNKTGRNLGKIQIHFEITGDNIPTIVGKSIIVPDGFPSTGAREIQTNDPRHLIFEFDSFNISKDPYLLDSFRIELIFLGSETPDIKLSVSEKGLTIKPYSLSGYSMFTYRPFVIYLLIAYLLIMGLFAWYFQVGSKLAKEHIRNRIKVFLAELEEIKLTKEQIESIGDKFYKFYRNIDEGNLAIKLPWKKFIESLKSSEA